VLLSWAPLPSWFRLGGLAFLGFARLGLAGFRLAFGRRRRSRFAFRRRGHHGSHFFHHADCGDGTHRQVITAVREARDAHACGQLDVGEMHRLIDIQG